MISSTPWTATTVIALEDAREELIENLRQRWSLRTSRIESPSHAKLEKTSAVTPTGQRPRPRPSPAARPGKPGEGFPGCRDGEVGRHWSLSRCGC